MGALFSVSAYPPYHNLDLGMLSGNWNHLIPSSVKITTQTFHLIKIKLLGYT